MSGQGRKGGEKTARVAGRLRRACWKRECVHRCLGAFLVLRKKKNVLLAQEKKGRTLPLARVYEAARKKRLLSLHEKIGGASEEGRENGTITTADSEREMALEGRGRCLLTGGLCCKENMAKKGKVP